MRIHAVIIFISFFITGVQGIMPVLRIWWVLLPCIPVSHMLCVWVHPTGSPIHTTCVRLEYQRLEVVHPPHPLKCVMTTFSIQFRFYVRSFQGKGNTTGKTENTSSHHENTSSHHKNTSSHQKASGQTVRKKYSQSLAKKNPNFIFVSNKTKTLENIFSPWALKAKTIIIDPKVFLWGWNTLEITLTK